MISLGSNDEIERGEAQCEVFEQAATSRFNVLWQLVAFVVQAARLDRTPINLIICFAIDLNFCGENPFTNHGYAYIKQIVEAFLQYKWRSPNSAFVLQVRFFVG